MTREEAIKKIKKVIEESVIFEDELEAFDIAIKALEHPEKNVVAVVPCGDAISRQAVLEGIRNLYPDIPIVDIMGARRKWLEKYAPYFECENVVEQLPSVTPKTPQPCEDEDCISRAIVQEEITKSIELKENPYQLWHRIRALPSVTLQQRTGRWIKTRLDDEPDKICDDCGTYCWKCSICGNDASGWGNFKYCPKCGARMEVEE